MKRIHIIIFVLFAWIEVAIFHAYFIPPITYSFMGGDSPREVRDTRHCNGPCPEENITMPSPLPSQPPKPTDNNITISNPLPNPLLNPKNNTKIISGKIINTPTKPAPAIPPKKNVNTPPPVLAQMHKNTAASLVLNTTAGVLTAEQQAERAKRRKEEMAIVPLLPRQTIISNPKNITLPSVAAPAIDIKLKSKAAIVQKNYDEDLRKAAARYAQYSQDWAHPNSSSDPNGQVSCFRESSLPCRRLPGLPKNLPSNFKDACAPIFALVGTPKSGTTSFYYYLIQHPQVNQALSGNYNKEVRYFAEFFNKGSGWYIQQFPPITPNDITFPGDTEPRVHMANGEASPTYFLSADAPARIKAVTPEMKLIALMADPVKRAYSEKMMYENNRQIPFRRNLYEDVKYQIDVFTKCWQNSINDTRIDQTDLYFKCLTQREFTGRLTPPYVLNSIYIHQVRNFLRYFPRDQILFLKSEDLQEKTRETMDQITDFIGLCRFEWGNITDVLYNKRQKQYNPIPGDVQALLTNFYKNYTYQFYHELDVDWNWPSA